MFQRFQQTLTIQQRLVPVLILVAIIGWPFLLMQIPFSQDFYQPDVVNLAPVILLPILYVIISFFVMAILFQFVLPNIPLPRTHLDRLLKQNK